jgi:hypothetical protein
VIIPQGSVSLFSTVTSPFVIVLISCTEHISIVVRHTISYNKVSRTVINNSNDNQTVFYIFSAVFIDNEMVKIPKSDQSQNTSRNTNQRYKWANTDPRIYWRWDQVPRRSKHPLLIDHTCRELSSMIMNAELSTVKVSVSSTV